jgi:hypothetical protein
LQIGHLLANLSRNSKPPDVQDPIDDGIDNQNTVKLDDVHMVLTLCMPFIAAGSTTAPIVLYI